MDRGSGAVSRPALEVGSFGANTTEQFQFLILTDWLGARLLAFPLAAMNELESSRTDSGGIWETSLSIRCDQTQGWPRRCRSATESGELGQLTCFRSPQLAHRPARCLWQPDSREQSRSALPFRTHPRSDASKRQCEWNPPRSPTSIVFLCAVDARQPAGHAICEFLLSHICPL